MHESIIAKRNQYAVKGPIATLTVVRRDGSEHTARFDANRLDEVQRRAWHVKTSRDGRVGFYTGDYWHGTLRPLAHLLAGTPEHPGVVYHVNGDPDDCRAENLRHGSRSDVAMTSHARRRGE